jgi:hypothetical protein
VHFHELYDDTTPSAEDTQEPGLYLHLVCVNAVWKVYVGQSADIANRQKGHLLKAVNNVAAQYRMCIHKWHFSVFTNYHPRTGEITDWSKWIRLAIAVIKRNFRGVLIGDAFRLFDELTIITILHACFCMGKDGFNLAHLDGLGSLDSMMPTTAFAVVWVRLAERAKESGEKFPAQLDEEGWKKLDDLHGGMYAPATLYRMTRGKHRPDLVQILSCIWPMPPSAFTNWPPSLPSAPPELNRGRRYKGVQYERSNLTRNIVPGSRAKEGASHKQVQAEGGDDAEMMDWYNN